MFRSFKKISRIRKKTPYIARFFHKSPICCSKTWLPYERGKKNSDAEQEESYLEKLIYRQFLTFLEPIFGSTLSGERVMGARI